MMACFLSSPKLAACAADLSSHYPDSALGFGAVCHLIVSALVCWPVYGWIPGLFHTLLSGVQTSSVPALGPKETCSFLCILVWKSYTSANYFLLGVCDGMHSLYHCEKFNIYFQPNRYVSSEHL